MELDPKGRQSPDAVYQRLLPYEDDIKNLREFATSAQGSPNRVNGPETYARPVVAPRGYSYEGPVLVKSQLVPEPKQINDTQTQQISSGVPVTFTSSQGPSYVPSSYPTGAPATASYYTSPYTYTSGSASSGIGALNPHIPTTSSTYTAGAPLSYQYPYQPTRVVAPGPATTTYTNPLPTTATYSAGNPSNVVFTSGPIYTTSIPSSGYAYTGSSYNPPAATSSYQPGYTYTTAAHQ